MKLFEVTVLDDTDEINYLTVSNKTPEQLEEEIKNDSRWSCFMNCWAREVNEVDGYKISLTKKII